MKRNKLQRLLCTVILSIVVFATGFTPIVSYGASYSESMRIAINQEKLNQIAVSDATVLARYKDASLKDMFETNELGMTAVQKKVVKEKADELIAARAKELGKTTLTDYEKLRVFHDWISQNFYYYRYVNKINGEDCDNPYYLITKEYKKSGSGNKKIRSRCNGFAATFIALARSQGIVARAIGGEYIYEARAKEPDEVKAVWSGITELIESHQWTMAYVDRNGDGVKEWITVDCNADCWNQYNPTTGYNNGGNFYGDKYHKVREAYFDPSLEDLSKTHIIMSFRPGSKDVKYITDPVDCEKLSTFLNIKSQGKTNGFRINESYNSSKSETWFRTDDKNSRGDGNGKLYKLYWPAKANLYGALDLSGCTSLQNVDVSENKLTRLTLKGCPSLSTVAASQNNLKTVEATGCKDLRLLSVQGNPTTYVKYDFNGKNTATFKVDNNIGGKVSVRYSKSGSKYSHAVSAFANSGYKFVGWYSGTSLKSSSSKITKTNKSSFTYTAGFAKTLSKAKKPTATKSGSNVKISWKKVTGADGYQVTQYTKSGSRYKKVTSCYTTGITKSFAAKKGTRYYYKVRAYDKVCGKKHYGAWSSYKEYKR